MRSGAKVIVKVEIDFDVIPDIETVTSVLLDIADLSPEFKDKVARGDFDYEMVNN
tara:strand:+ start:93 stop:257 length:165 start_codon:yes stop_codon:yes gene_type:complete